eukprot:296187-Prymnesium_polylepis.1
MARVALALAHRRVPSRHLARARVAAQPRARGRAVGPGVPCEARALRRRSAVVDAMDARAAARAVVWARHRGFLAPIARIAVLAVAVEPRAHRSVRRRCLLYTSPSPRDAHES